MSVLVRNGVSATAAVRMGMLRAFGLGPSLHQRAASFCQYGAKLDLLRNSFDLAPLLHQGAPAPRVALVGQTKADDPIGSKVPIVLAQLAPRRQHAAAIEEAEHDRPDRSPRALTLGVGIPEDELALRADRLPYRGEIDPLFLRLGARPRKQAAVVHALAQVVREDRGDLADSVGGRARERLVGALRDPSRPQDEGLDFLVGEHQGRQHESGPEHVADPGLAVDRGALADQRLDVAVDRAKRHAELVGQRLTADRMTMSA